MSKNRLTRKEFCDELANELSRATWPNPFVPEGADRRELMEIVILLGDYVRKARNDGSR